LRSVLVLVACLYTPFLFFSRRAYTVQVVRKDGHTSEFECPPDSTILDAAEEAGIDDLPYSCRAGACAACAGKVQQGTVDQGGQAFLDEDQQKKGYCLTCVAYPTSDVVLKSHAEGELLTV
jgi:ferredoxin